MSDTLGCALPIRKLLLSQSMSFVFKLFGQAPTVGKRCHLLQLMLRETTSHSLPLPIFQLVIIDAVGL